MWRVFDSSLCPDDNSEAEACLTPKAQSCEKAGCGMLEANFQDRVKYDPALDGYLTGAKVNIGLLSGYVKGTSVDR